MDKAVLAPWFAAAVAVLELAFVAENIPSQPANEDDIAPAVTAIAVFNPNAK